MLLHRINPEKNEARFYLVEAAPSLLDPFAVLRVWGRIGGAQQHKINPCASAAEAEQLAKRLIRRKLKRGYKPCESPQGDKVVGEKNEQEEEKEANAEKSAASNPPAGTPRGRPAS